MDTTYPERQPINRQELAVRHLLLEEIKHRLIGRAATGADAALLEAIADALAVHHDRHDRAFVICLGETPVLPIPDGELLLYVRGDSDRAARRQEELQLRRNGDPDAALSRNRRRLVDAVDQLRDAVRENPALLEKVHGAD
ncbi:MAG: hypothetical protein HY331_05415 [Chloroflexi bacterium]|nr:hypothetical protein [Chloroflexota bacterium]